MFVCDSMCRCREYDCVWQCVQVWGNGCTHYRLSQHWVNLRVQARNAKKTHTKTHTHTKKLLFFRTEFEFRIPVQIVLGLILMKCWLPASGCDCTIIEVFLHWFEYRFLLNGFCCCVRAFLSSLREGVVEAEIKSFSTGNPELSDILSFRPWVDESKVSFD